MIHVKDLSFSYTGDERCAVKNISFDIEKGEIFGFLGPSGAGKSTTQGILTGLLPLQKGEAQVDGYDLHKENKKRFNRIGMSFEQSNLYGKLTAEENLRYYAKLFDVPTRDPQMLIDMVGLGGKEHIKAGTFSKGMKHRLTFARSLLNNPVMWFLDEPTTGLDPAIAAQIKEIIRSECDTGVTAFLTTHNMFIADELCNRVAFIVDGELKLIDSPKALKLQLRAQDGRRGVPGRRRREEGNPRPRQTRGQGAPARNPRYLRDHHHALQRGDAGGNLHQGHRKGADGG